MGYVAKLYSNALPLFFYSGMWVSETGFIELFENIY